MRRKQKNAITARDGKEGGGGRRMIGLTGVGEGYRASTLERKTDA